MSFFEQGLYKSVTAGSSWNKIGPGAYVTGLEIDPQDTETLYVATGGGDQGDGVFKSVDGGANWLQVNSGFQIPDRDEIIVHALEMNARDSRTLYAAAGERVFETTDAGGSWVEIASRSSYNFACNECQFTALTADPQIPGRMYALGEEGVYLSGDSGRSWAEIGSGLPMEYVRSNIRSMALDPQSSTTLYVGTLGDLLEPSDDETYGVFKTADLGENWIEMSGGLPDTPVAYLEIARLSPPKVYAATFGGGVFAKTLAEDGNVSASDFDGNGEVDFSDFFLFADHFGVAEGDDGYSSIYDLDGSGENRTVGFLSVCRQLRQGEQPIGQSCRVRRQS